MVERNTCINVWSDMNTWIDFCVIVHPKDISIAEEIIEKAYDDWFEMEDLQFEPIADYVGRCLFTNGIGFEIYFKEEEIEE